MALPSFPSGYPPLLDSDQEPTEIATLLAPFGDGARQETEDGLNAEATDPKWSWHLAKADIDTIVSFLRTNAVSGFQFTSPVTGETKQFKCLRRHRREVTPDSDRLDCEFEQIFDNV